MRSSILLCSTFTLRAVGNRASVSRRYLHLVPGLLSKGAPRNKVKSLPRKTLPIVEWKCFRLRKEKNAAPIVVTLSQALKLIRPSTYLANTSPSSRNPRYTILPLKQAAFKKTPEQRKRGKLGAQTKEFHLRPSCSPPHIAQVMSKSYAFILEGYRVEFHLRGPAPAKENEDYSTVDWALKNSMHLRPESILAAMPEGTTYLMEPVTDGDEIIWALEHKEHLKEELPLSKKVTEGTQKHREKKEEKSIDTGKGVSDERRVPMGEVQQIKNQHVNLGRLHFKRLLVGQDEERYAGTWHVPLSGEGRLFSKRSRPNFEPAATISKLR